MVKRCRFYQFPFYYSLSNEKDKKYKIDLLNSLKLYVGNLGTTHHGNDEENSLNIALADQWQKSLEGTNFISPVLHGTTGSSDNTFSLASNSCYKINIAGSFFKNIFRKSKFFVKRVVRL